MHLFVRSSDVTATHGRPVPEFLPAFPVCIDAAQGAMLVRVQVAGREVLHSVPVGPEFVASAGQHGQAKLAAHAARPMQSQGLWGAPQSQASFIASQAMHAAGHRANTTPDASSMDGCSSFGSGWAPAPAGPALTQQQFPAAHGAGDARASPEQLSAVPHWAAAQRSTHTLAPGGSSMAFTALPGAAHERWPATVPAAQTHGVPGLSPAASAAPNAAPRPPALATQPGAVCTAQQGWSAEYHAAYATPPHSMPQTTWGSGGTEHLGITAASRSAPLQLLGGSAQRSAQLGGLPRHDLLPVPATSSRGKFLGVSEKPKNGKFECRVYLGRDTDSTGKKVVNNKYIGRFSSAKEAAMKHDEVAVAHGVRDPRRLNFPHIFLAGGSDTAHLSPIPASVLASDPSGASPLQLPL